MLSSVPLCNFILDNGSRCHCAATTGKPFCRHHSPEALADRRARVAAQSARRQASAPSPSARIFSRRSHWRRYHKRIGNASPAEFLTIIQDLMDGLQRGLLSHRCAGRLLHEVQQRRQVVAIQYSCARVRQLAGHAIHFTDQEWKDLEVKLLRDPAPVSCDLRPLLGNAI